MINEIKSIDIMKENAKGANTLIIKSTQSVDRELGTKYMSKSITLLESTWTEKS